MAFGSLEPSRVPLRTPGRSPYGSPVVIESRADMALLPQVLGIASLGFLASALGVYFAPPIYGSAMMWICAVDLRHRQLCADLCGAGDTGDTRAGVWVVSAAGSGDGGGNQSLDSGAARHGAHRGGV